MAKEKSDQNVDVDALVNAFGPELGARLAEELNGGGQSATVQPEELSIQQLLVDTAMDVTGRPALTGMPFIGNLPMWAQGAAAKGALDYADFDPYLGVVSQPGDERVYLGVSGTRVPFSFDELDDQLDTEGNLRTDRANKVERQLGGDPSRQKAGEKKVDDTATSTQVKNQPYLWDQDEVASAMKKMRRSGIPVKTFDQMLATWGSMVDRAANTYSLSQGSRKITPWDVLDMYKSEAKAAGSFTDFEERMNGTRTSTTRSVSEITEGQAFATLQRTMSQLLGRDPSDDEVKDFLHRANTLAARNPSITNTVRDFENGKLVSTTNNTDPGFTGDDLAQAAYESTQANPEYAEEQAATTYFQATQQALAAIGEG